MTLGDLKTLSEIFSNFASPFAVVVAAFIAVWGAKEIVEKVVVARGEGATAFAQPLSGTATVTPSSVAPQGTAIVIPAGQDQN